MKAEETNLTINELDELCKLYMECGLSVSEEKELEYVLSRIDVTSPAIDQVRALMNIQLLPLSPEPTVTARSRNWRYLCGIAASMAVIISLAVFALRPSGSTLVSDDGNVYIAAYSHGKRLSGSKAEAATDRAMAKADSLMNYAAMAEREYMLKAESIINESFNN